MQCPWRAATTAQRGRDPTRMFSKLKLLAEWLLDRIILPWLPTRTPKIPSGQEDGQ